MQKTEETVTNTSILLEYGQKSKDNFGCYKKKYMIAFPKGKSLLIKHMSKNAAKKTFLLTKYFLVLIVIVNFFLCCDSLWFIMKKIIFFYISQAQDLFNKKKAKKSLEEIKKEILESILNERLEDLELINKADDGLTLLDALECVKQYEKHLQNEKRKIINITYKQGRILHQLKEFEEFIDTLVKRLKISKSAISFKMNFYKLLKNTLY